MQLYIPLPLQCNVQNHNICNESNGLGNTQKHAKDGEANTPTFCQWPQTFFVFLFLPVKILCDCLFLPIHGCINVSHSYFFLSINHPKYFYRRIFQLQMSNILPKSLCIRYYLNFLAPASLGHLDWFHSLDLTRSFKAFYCFWNWVMVMKEVANIFMAGRCIFLCFVNFIIVHKRDMASDIFNHENALFHGILQI